MFCPACGKEVANGARFCSHCGSPAGAPNAAPIIARPTPPIPSGTSPFVAPGVPPSGHFQTPVPGPPPPSNYPSGYVAPPGAPFHPAYHAPYQDQVTGRRGSSPGVYAEGKSAFLAAILSLLIVGLGQFYNGDVKKGVLMLVGAIFFGMMTLSLAWWGIAIWSAIDAYLVASRSSPLWK